MASLAVKRLINLGVGMVLLALSGCVGQLRLGQGTNVDPSTNWLSGRVSIRPAAIICFRLVPAKVNGQ